MRVVWFRRAVSDLALANSFIELDEPAAARRVVENIKRAIEILSAQPAIGRPGRITGTRELVVTGTPFIIPYRVRDDVIQILRVLHGARRWPKGV